MSIRALAAGRRHILGRVQGDQICQVIRQPWSFGFREMTLVAWAGLKGAAPIILATFPLVFGLPNGQLLFNIVSFDVLVSATTHGWSLPLVARKLGLRQETQPEPPISLENTSLKDVNADIVDYTVGPESRAAHRLIRELALPESVVVAMISRARSSRRAAARAWSRATTASW